MQRSIEVDEENVYTLKINYRGEEQKETQTKEWM